MKRTDYQTIIDVLHAANLPGLEGSLILSVDNEAEVLLSRVQRRTRAAVTACRFDAQQYYASEILEALFDGPPDTIQPEKILHTRRGAAVWAIATIMRREGLAGAFPEQRRAYDARQDAGERGCDGDALPAVPKQAPTRSTSNVITFPKRNPQ